MSIQLHASFSGTGSKDIKLDLPYNLQVDPKGSDTGEIATDHAPELLETIYRAAQLAINKKWVYGEVSDDELESTQLKALVIIVKGAA